ncbi:hypothetical protein [Candidatus Cetobacterium colombiensis]|jgi:hypothetical protein|uniref:Phage protein n=1 Tax=Candidatus Cetobacterium colombiensis TaxID=3073100 RepID=A0ABU4WET9_9FUSO|nr:hypothetical protein [Candidatus Cetobacterium colombiensis]MDX8337224.1 hypothetical protein [Candidatus Cetobacterium colombiensis]
MALKRGGTREKAGKKRVFENPVDINARLEKSELEMVLQLVDGKTNSEKIRSIIKFGLEALQAQENS